MNLHDNVLFSTKSVILKKVEQLGKLLIKIRNINGPSTEHDGESHEVQIATSPFRDTYC